MEPDTSTQAVSASFEMTDAFFAKAIRQELVALAREHLQTKELLVIAACVPICYLSLSSGSHWLWLVSGLPPAILIILMLAWSIAWWWLPKAAVQRLAHLPHRRVTVELFDTRLAFQTATERLEVSWEELQALKRLPDFWLIGLRSGARIPVPVGVLSAQAVSILSARMPAPAP